MAVGIDVQGRINLDTSGAQQQIRTLTSSIEDMNNATSTDSTQQPLIDNTTNAVNSSLSADSIDQARENNEELKRILAVLENQRTENTTRYNANQSRYHALSYGGTNTAVANTATAVQQLMNGQLLPIGQSLVSNAGHGLQNKAQTFSKEHEGGKGVASVLGGLGTVGVIVSALMSIAGAGYHKAVNAYEGNLPGIENLYKRFGDLSFISNRDYTTNASFAHRQWQNVTALNRGTNLSNDEFIARTANMAQYGYRNADSAGLAVRAAGNMANLTGMDIDQIQRIQGLNWRYGGLNGSATVNDIYRSAGRAGITMEELQKHLPEFLQNIESAMENGVSNGFTSSVAEVADSIGFLSSLSNDEAWKHNVGHTYQSISSGLAGAVNLTSTSDMIAYQAMSRIDDETVKKTLGKTATGISYLDKAQMLESNPSSKMLNAIHSQLKDTYGDDMMSGVLTYKEMYGLNTKGAVTLYNALNDGRQDSAKVLTDLTSDSQYKSDSSQMQDSLNNINKTLTGIGHNLYSITQWTRGKEAEWLQKIYSKMNFKDRDAYKKKVKPILSSGFYTNGNYSYLKDDGESTGHILLNESNDLAKTEDFFDRKLKNVDTYEEAQNSLDLLEGLTDEEKLYFNMYDVLENMPEQDYYKYLLKSKEKASEAGNFNMVGASNNDIAQMQHMIDVINEKSSYSGLGTFSPADKANLKVAMGAMEVSPGASFLEGSKITEETENWPTLMAKITDKVKNNNNDEAFKELLNEMKKMNDQFMELRKNPITVYQ